MIEPSIFIPMMMRYAIRFILYLTICYSSSYAVSSPYRVSLGGEDSIETDGIQSPWRTIGYALSRIPEAGNCVIQVNSGTYPAVSTTRCFKEPVVIRSDELYKARIVSENGNGPVLLNGARNITLQGLVLNNNNNPHVSNVLQILGGSRDITVRDCILTHGNRGYFNADAVKVHGGVHNVLLERNIVFHVMDELLEISDRSHDVFVRKNVFYQDESKGRKKTVAALFDTAWRIVMDGNVFIQGGIGGKHEFIDLGYGDVTAAPVWDIAVINNHFVSPSPHPFRARDLQEKVFWANNTNSGHPVFIEHGAGPGKHALFAVDNPLFSELDFPDDVALIDRLKRIRGRMKTDYSGAEEFSHNKEIPESLQRLMIDYSTRTYSKKE